MESIPPINMGLSPSLYISTQIDTMNVGAHAPPTPVAPGPVPASPEAVEQAITVTQQKMADAINGLLKANNIAATPENVRNAEALFTYGQKVTPDTLQAVHQALRAAQRGDPAAVEGAAILVARGLPPTAENLEAVVAFLAAPPFAQGLDRMHQGVRRLVQRLAPAVGGPAPGAVPPAAAAVPAQVGTEPAAAALANPVPTEGEPLPVSVPPQPGQAAAARPAPGTQSTVAPLAAPQVPAEGTETVLALPVPVEAGDATPAAPTLLPGGAPATTDAPQLPARPVRGQTGQLPNAATGPLQVSGESRVPAQPAALPGAGEQALPAAPQAAGTAPPVLPGAETGPPALPGAAAELPPIALPAPPAAGAPPAEAPPPPAPGTPVAGALPAPAAGPGLPSLPPLPPALQAAAADLLRQAQELDSAVVSLVSLATPLKPEAFAAQMALYRQQFGRLEGEIDAIEHQIRALLPPDAPDAELELAPPPQLDENADRAFASLSRLLAGEPEAAEKEQAALAAAAKEALPEEVRALLAEVQASVQAVQQHVQGREVLTQPMPGLPQVFCIPIAIPGTMPPRSAELYIYKDPQQDEQAGEEERTLRMRLALETKHLGTVAVDFEAKARDLRCTINVAAAAAQQLINKRLSELQEKLEGTRLRLKTLNVRLARDDIATSQLIPARYRPSSLRRIEGRL